MLGEQIDKTLEMARMRQTLAMQQLTEKAVTDIWPDQEVFNRRKWLLVPLNLMLLLGTITLPRHQAKIAKVITGGKLSLKSLFLVSTVQALFFTSLLVSTNCFVIGVNPLRIFSLLRQKLNEEEDYMKDFVVSDTDVIPGLPQGTKYSDLPENLQNVMFEQSMTTVILIDFIKNLGL